jgi:hypothetical protein
MSFQSTRLAVTGSVARGASFGGTGGELGAVALVEWGGVAVVVAMNRLVYYRGGRGLWWRVCGVAELNISRGNELERRCVLGNEVKCAMRVGRNRTEGKALLETAEIIFRGATRLKIPFAEMKSVEAVKGDLVVKVGGELVAFEVGEKVAAKWREKILHPKSRIEKLGVKPGARVSVIGKFEPGFLRELRDLKCVVNSGAIAGGAEWIFVLAESEKDLSLVEKHAKKMKGAVGLWMVYPKGRKDITEVGVISAGRKAGLKDVKVVGFSTTHTALKFVIPLTGR